MPNQTYYNPSSFHPQTDPGSVPTGAIQGYQWATDRDRYNELMDVFQQQQQMGLQRSQMDLNEHIGGAPTRRLQQEALGATAQATSRNIGPQELAKTIKLQSEANVAIQEQASKIATFIAENYSKMKGFDVTNLQNDIILAGQYAEAYQKGDLNVLTKFSPKAMENPAIQMIMKSPDSKRVAAAMQTELLQTLPDQIKADRKAKEDREKQREMSASQLEGVKYTADKSTEWHRAAIGAAAAERATKQKWDQRMMELQRKSSSEEAGIKGSITKAEAIELNVMYRREFSKAQAGAGVGAGTTAAFVPGQGIPVPQAMQVPLPGEDEETPINRTKRFRQGTYKKTKSGPDNDIKNWTKVD